MRRRRTARLVAHVPSEARRPPARLRQALADLGWQETIGFSFVDERWERDFAGNAEPVRVLNPIAQSLSVMRSSLVGSLVEALKVNLARKSDARCACSSSARCTCATRACRPATPRWPACASR